MDTEIQAMVEQIKRVIGATAFAKFVKDDTTVGEIRAHCALQVDQLTAILKKHLLNVPAQQPPTK